MLKKILDKQMKNRYLIYLMLFAYTFGAFLGVVVHPVGALNGDYTLLYTFNSGYHAHPSVSYHKEYYASSDVGTYDVKAYRTSDGVNVYTALSSSQIAQTCFSNQHNFLGATLYDKQIVYDIDSGNTLFSRSSTVRLFSNMFDGMVFSYDDAYMIYYSGEYSTSGYFNAVAYNVSSGLYNQAVSGAIAGTLYRGYGCHFPRNKPSNEFINANYGATPFYEFYDIVKTGTYTWMCHKVANVSYSSWANVDHFEYLWYDTYGYIIGFAVSGGKVKLRVNVITHTSMTNFQDIDFGATDAAYNNGWVHLLPDGTIIMHYDNSLTSSAIDKTYVFNGVNYTQDSSNFITPGYGYGSSYRGSGTYDSSTDINYYIFSNQTKTVIYSKDSGDFSGGASLESCGSYEAIGTVGIGNEGRIVNPSSQYMIGEYRVQDNYTIKRIDLQVNQKMAEMPLTNFYLKLNQHDVGIPNSMKLISGDTYILSWTGLDLAVNDKSVLYILKSFNKNSEGNYFDVDYTTTDLNDDGISDILFLSSGNGGYFDNFNTLYYSYIPNPGFSWSDREPIIRFCVQRNIAELHNYPNLLYVESSSLCRNESTRAYYFINYSSMGKTNKLFFDPPVGVTTLSFIYGESGFKSFFFNASGTYRINLSINSVNVSSKTVTVGGCEQRNWVFTEPNPSTPCQDVRVFYHYNETTPGIIKMFDDQGIEIYSQGIPGNSIGSVTVNTLCTSGVYRVDLLTYISVYNTTLERTVLSRQYYHYVGRVTPAFLDADRYNISLGMSVLFNGYHSFVGSDVYIKVGQQYIKNVGGFDDFSWSYRPVKSGSFTCSLVLSLPNGNEVTLHTMSHKLIVFQVHGFVPPGQEPSDAFSPEMKALFGICCVIVSVCVPLMISVKYHVNVPTFVYVIFMSFGIALGVKMGFLDLWLVFLFVVALVAGAAYTIFGHGGPGPGQGGETKTVRERVLSRPSRDQGVKRER